jgi:hypothetical protein
MSAPVLRLSVALVVSATFAAITTPAAAHRACTNSELGRVSDSFTIDCFKKPQARVRCQSNGDPVCCSYTPWGEKCTTTPGASSFDPGPGPTRPPRAGRPDRPPDRVNPPSRPPRAGDPGSGPGRVGPANDPKPPRADPGPSRVGPASNPSPSGPTIKSGGGGSSKR